MVTQFGMSEVVGLMAIGDAPHEVFLGRDFGSKREVSEQTAQMVDGEIKRLLDEAYAKALELLNAHRALLDRISEALLERETIGREDLALLEQDLPLPPRAAPILAESVASTESSRSGASNARPVLGTPPAEPAGA
jgi:cell division protease FtsH